MDLYIRENEFVTLLGPSGCGKTTTLRIIAGFETPDVGQVFFEGRDITSLPPEKREVNTVFQKYSLFTHMSVEENIAFGLKIKKKSKEYIRDKIKYALKLVNLDGYEKRYPDTLSGGQQQRIAIARAIVNEPKVLLLDEPLGALDLKLRQSMQLELIRLKEELGITFVYVTHDQDEALTMSDTIVIMNQGYIQQIGTPVDIYNEPDNAFVAKFVGDANMMDGKVIDKAHVEMLGVSFDCTDEGFDPGSAVDVVVRPEDVVLCQKGEGTIDGVVAGIIFKGVHYEMKVEAGGFDWIVRSTKSTEPGSEVGIKIDPFNIRLMPKPASDDEKSIDEV
ncbi:MAG: ABC transporter ATP-binding protein [Lachnospiraceae bacterium]|nr:ABC transporter ATP-binding protein [Lachnospiraceae bacterium]